MTYITNNQKLNNLNRFKLDILFDQLMNKLELSKSYDFWFEMVDNIQQFE